MKTPQTVRVGNSLHIKLFEDQAFDTIVWAEFSPETRTVGLHKRGFLGNDDMTIKLEELKTLIAEIEKAEA